MYQGIIERVEKRLVGWKCSCLSLAGRLTLIQSTVCAIPTYVKQTARIPRSTCYEIVRKIRRFLWGGTGLDRRIHLAPWALVTRAVNEGGLRIRAMRDLNAALLMKLGWCMLTESESTWARVLRFKYCQGRDLLHPHNKTQATTVSNGWRGVLENLSHLQRGAGMAVGDGRATQFWLDRWAEPSPLLMFTTKHVPTVEMEHRV